MTEEVIMITTVGARLLGIAGDLDPTPQTDGAIEVEMDVTVVATLPPEIVMDAVAEVTTVNAALLEDVVARRPQNSLKLKDGLNMTAACHLAASKSSVELYSSVALRTFLVL